MVIRINTDILKKFGITADDFLYLYLLHATSYDLIDELDLKPNTEALQTKGLIKLGEELQDHVVRQAFLDSFQDSFDRYGLELLPLSSRCTIRDRCVFSGPRMQMQEQMQRLEISIKES